MRTCNFLPRRRFPTLPYASSLHLRIPRQRHDRRRLDPFRTSAAGRVRGVCRIRPLCDPPRHCCRGEWHRNCLRVCTEPRRRRPRERAALFRRPRLWVARVTRPPLWPTPSLHPPRGVRSSLDRLGRCVEGGRGSSRARIAPDLLCCSSVQAPRRLRRPPRRPSREQPSLSQASSSSPSSLWPAAAAARPAAAAAASPTRSRACGRRACTGSSPFLRRRRRCSAGWRRSSSTRRCTRLRGTRCPSSSRSPRSGAPLRRAGRGSRSRHVWRRRGGRLGLGTSHPRTLPVPLSPGLPRQDRRSHLPRGRLHLRHRARGAAAPRAALWSLGGPLRSAV